MIEKHRKVAIFGGVGSFHEQAAKKYFSEEPDMVIEPHSSFSTLVRSLEKDASLHIGVMAIENTIAGSIIGNYILLQNSKLKITGEIMIRIQHHLMALPGTALQDIREVYSHPMAIAQCDKFLSDHPQIRVIEERDTSFSAMRIQKEQLPHSAAIAGEQAAKEYGLQIVEKNIETVAHNYTRFLVLERNDHTYDDTAEKFTISFEIPYYQTGTLHHVLTVINEFQANILKLQTVPLLNQPWEYIFFLDIIVENPSMVDPLLEALKETTIHLYLWGTYKKGKVVHH